MASSNVQRAAYDLSLSLSRPTPEGDLLERSILNTKENGELELKENGNM